MPRRDAVYEQILATLRHAAPEFLREPDDAQGIASFARWLTLPGGCTLFKQGEPSDAIYVVLSGVLGIWVEDSAGRERLIERVGPGEFVGEMGCITGQPRSATVRALRSSELLAFSWNDVEQMATRDPAVLLSICRTVVQRLIQTQTGKTAEFQPHSFALTSVGEGVDLRSFGQQFQAALSVMGMTFLATRRQCQHMTADELFQLERSHRYLVYVTEPDAPSWSNVCLRQADTIVVVAKGDRTPQPAADFRSVVSPNIPLVLLLIWEPDLQPHGTAKWITVSGIARHFHVRRPADLHRVARLLTGSGFGLVLSGGGARGLAHLGVARALRANGIEIDIIMGTSVGALIGAGIALELDDELLLEKAQQFCRMNLLFELTIPRQSLLAGRHLRASLQHWFGDLQIEDTPIPYSCVSTNLNTAELAVHQFGDLQMWITASAAVPGVFPPVVVDGIVHVDGGVLNNMPSDLIRANGAGFVLGVDVAEGALPLELDASPTWPMRPRLNILELLARVGCIGAEARSAVQRKQCDILLVPPLPNIGLLSFGEYERAIESGYRLTLEKLPLLMARKSAEISDASTMRS